MAGTRQISNRVFIGMLAVMGACLVLISMLRVSPKTPGQAMAFTWWFFALICAWGTAGFLLSRRTGFPELWADEIPSRKRFGIPAAIGLVVGLGAIGFDVLRPVAAVYGVDSVHHPLPQAIPLYLYAALVSAMLFYLLPVPLFIYLASNLAQHGRNQQAMFWLAAVIFAGWESRRFFLDPAQWDTIEFARHGWGYLANLSEIWMFRRYGFLAALAQRLAGYSLWHLLWPAMQ